MLSSGFKRNFVEDAMRGINRKYGFPADENLNIARPFTVQVPKTQIRTTKEATNHKCKQQQTNNQKPQSYYLGERTLSPKP